MDLESLILGPVRKIGDIQADVTILEHHHDSLTMTRHPVEKGANITDHAYKEPADLTIRCGWGDSTFASLINSVIDISDSELLSRAIGNTLSIDEVYEALLKMQEDRETLTIYTGKRKYDDMLLVDINVMTDLETENSLMATLKFRQVLYVSTSITTVPSAYSTSTDDQSDSEDTSSIVSQGLKAAKAQASAIYELLMGE